MRLKELAHGLGCVVPDRFAGLDVPALWDDSRRVTPESLFASLPAVCVQTGDGNRFIADALARGARVVLAPGEQAASLVGQYPDICIISAKDPRAVFFAMVSRFYGYPARQVKVIGVTGTNGKTTFTYFLEAIIKAAGFTCGVVGTVNCRVGGCVVPSKNTTPGFLDNQIFLAGLATQGVGYGVMEVSSHGLSQFRVDPADFHTAVFTNLTGDHLDLHKTMEEYFKAKARLFTGLPAGACAVINIDDPYGQRLLSMTAGRVITYAIDAAADVTAKIHDFSLAGTQLIIRFFGQECTLHTHFIGRHNIYNILAAFAAALAEGVLADVICRGIASLDCVPGRLERVDRGQDFCVFIDYAHTDDGLLNVLHCLKAVPHNRLIVVFGCGGERDRTKRPRMGKIAGELADQVILTSDNPRSEDPGAIIADIVPGFVRKNYEICPAREAAIERALRMAQKNDIVLLAGKGHETYQVLKDRTIDFVERDIVTRILKS